MVRVSDLVSRWRERAGQLRPYAPGVAQAFEDAATELEGELERAADGVLSLREAAEYSLYSVDHLRRLVREGKLPNVGRPYAPRFRRGDLPRKPVEFDQEVRRDYDPVADARQVAAVRNRGGKR